MSRDGHARGHFVVAAALARVIAVLCRNGLVMTTKQRATTVATVRGDVGTDFSLVL